MLRRTHALRGHVTSNLLAPGHTGRWFNPPHQWMMTDYMLFMFCFSSPAVLFAMIYVATYTPKYSHYQDRYYYPTQPYTKEFIHKYKRLERWRFY